MERKTGAWPDRAPDAALAAELVDPYSGEPLHWAILPGELRAWSVGENRQDDHGEQQSDDRRFAIVVTTQPKP